VLAHALLAAAAVVVSPAGADTHTFDRAYHRAPAGSVVRVRPGAYPAQRLTPGGRRVVFAGSGGVTVGEVRLEGASNVEFRDMRIRGWTADGGSHITFRRVTTLGSFYIYAPASWVSVLGGSVGPSHNVDSYIAVPNDQVAAPSRHILIDGVRFHDVTRDAGVHVECLMLADGVDVVIRNSRFENCAVFDLFVTWWYFRPKVGPPTQVRIEHNVFGHTTDGYYSMLWADYVDRASLPWTAFTVSGNTCGQGASFATGSRRERFVLQGNRGC
jgi:hypothetical protein